MIELRTGELCYFETVRDGLVPCRMLSVDSYHITLKVTGNRAGYRVGELIGTTPMHAIPRGAVRRRKYATVILPYEIVR